MTGYVLLVFLPPSLYLSAQQSEKRIYVTMRLLDNTIQYNTILYLPSEQLLISLASSKRGQGL